MLEVQPPNCERECPEAGNPQLIEFRNELEDLPDLMIQPFDIQLLDASLPLRRQGEKNYNFAFLTFYFERSAQLVLRLQSINTSDRTNRFKKFLRGTSPSFKGLIQEEVLCKNALIDFFPVWKKFHDLSLTCL